jgi:hypothetical protein
MTVGPGGSGGYQPSYGAGYPAAYDPAGRAQLRAATADRDRAADLLNTAYAEGRLSKDEHEARLARVMSAATFAELDAVVADLPGGRPPAPPAPAGTNAMAIASLICGIGQMMFWPLITIPAIVLGHVARRQIRRTGEQGSGLALAGLILGYIGAGILALGILALILIVAAWGQSGTG